jgi:hypothetical protein
MQGICARLLREFDLFVSCGDGEAFGEHDERNRLLELVAKLQATSRT